MQRSSILSSPNCFSPFFAPPTNSLPIKSVSQNHDRTSTSDSIRLRCLHSSRVVLPLPHSTNTNTAFVETSTTGAVEESELIEIGYISNVHGLQGELRVKPNTDFPELRFSMPGKRWLKERISGKEIIREIELVEGREHSGQRSWIVTFLGIDTVDKAKQLVGSTILVSEEERPELEEGEFYTWELLGMKVILKDTGQSVGTVVNVFNSGASDLLQVMLNPNEETYSGPSSSKPGTVVSGPLVWVPFAEAIVPDVDMKKREIQITPPKGLLELNLRSDDKSKKERRKLEWQERKKGTRRLIAAKKKLSEMEQKHIFHGLRYGEKSQRSLLADHIVGINLKLFQQAMQNFEKAPMRWNTSKFINTESTALLRSPLRISEESLFHHETKDPDSTEEFKREGLRVISEGKIAIILVVSDKTCCQGRNADLEHGDSGSAANSSNISLLQALLHDDKGFEKVVAENLGLLPLVIISPANEIQSIKKLFLDNDYFGFDNEKVWFLEEENLPVVSRLEEEPNRQEILMKSPWEVLQSPVGSGGILSLLSSHNILDNLGQMGMEYVQVCSLGERSMIGHPSYVGFVSCCEADAGIKMFQGREDLEEEDIDIIFSLRFLKKITEEINKLQFHGVAKQNSHVELVDKEWVNIVPTSQNSYEFRCSIYSALNACSPCKICAVDV